MTDFRLPSESSLNTPAISNTRQLLLVFWTAATVLYALAIAERVFQQGWPKLTAVAGLSAMGGVWLCLLELEGRFKSNRGRTVRYVAARTLIAVSIGLNGVLLVRALLQGESLALIRLLSLTGLLYGFRIFSHWPHA